MSDKNDYHVDKKIKRDVDENSPELNVPLIQYAQKCPFCCKYLQCSDEIAKYNGNNKQFTDWICHKKCLE